VIPRPIILVVDDEPDNLDLIERVLGFDYEIHRAPNGEEALRVLRQVPDVAVIITDQKMPGLTGTEFLKKASVHQPEAVQMIVTGFVGTQELIEAINSTNVYRFMAKPWDVDEMIAVVQRAARLAAAGGGELIDELTGLPSWSLMRRELEREVARAAHTKLPLSLVAVRVEAYPEYAQVVGVGIAERLLVALGDELRRRIRSMDALGMAGRDVFLWLRSGPIEPVGSLEQQLGQVSVLVEARGDYPEIRATVKEAHFPADGETPADLLSKLGLGRDAARR